MGDSFLRLPATVQMGNVSSLWQQWQQSLRAEAAGVAAGAGRELQVNASELQQFDTSVLSLLLSAARLGREHGLSLRVQGAPKKLLDLAQLYGMDEVLTLQPA